MGPKNAGRKAGRANLSRSRTIYVVGPRQAIYPRGRRMDEREAVRRLREGDAGGRASGRRGTALIDPVVRPTSGGST